MRYNLHAVLRREQRDGIVQPRADFSPRFRRQLVPDDVQVDIDRGEILPKTIGQFRGQVTPLRFLDLDDTQRDRPHPSGMNARFRIRALACRDVNDGGTRVEKRLLAVSHHPDAQECVEQRPVFANQFSLYLRNILSRAERFNCAFVLAVATRGNDVGEFFRADELLAREAEPGHLRPVHAHSVPVPMS